MRLTTSFHRLLDEVGKDLLSMDKLTAVAARVMCENPDLNPESVQAGVNAALQEVYSVTL